MAVERLLRAKSRKHRTPASRAVPFTHTCTTRGPKCECWQTWTKNGIEYRGWMHPVGYLNRRQRRQRAAVARRRRPTSKEPQ